MRSLASRQKQGKRALSVGSSLTTVAKQQTAGATATFTDSTFAQNFTRIPIHGARPDGGVLQRQAIDDGKESGKVGTDPTMEMLQQSFQKSLARRERTEKLAGPIARALAGAYVSRSPNLSLSQDLRATPYIADRVPHEDWGEEEVYQAILEAIDAAQLAAMKSAADWHVMPGPFPEKKTRRDAGEEIADAVGDILLGGHDVEGIAQDKAKEAGERYVVRWLVRKGLTAIAEMLSLIGGVIAAFETAYTILDLMIVLKKPRERGASRNDAILTDVRRWLALQQPVAEEPSLQRPGKFGPYIAVPVSTGVRK